MAEDKTTEKASPRDPRRPIMVSTDDPEIKEYLTALANDPAFDHARREVVERLERAGIKITNR